MKCLVCDNNIRIDTLRQLCTLQPLLLCSLCAHYLIPKSVDVLYNDNEWIRSVIDKLNKGDIALTQLFKSDLQKALLKKKAIHSNIKIIEAKKELPYPWLKILVADMRLDSKDSQEHHLSPSTESIVITVEKQKNARNQIAIVG